MKSESEYSVLIIDDNVKTTQFACDLNRCKGACCTLPGGRGAPITDAECAEIERASPIAMKYLSEKSRTRIAEAGLWEGEDGFRALECIDEKDCVFVFYENTIAKCALERAYLNGETTFRKPPSCNLFPIRIARERDAEHIYIEHIPECVDGYRNGEKLKIRAVDFLREPLIRAYGEDITNAIASEQPHNGTISNRE